MGFFSNQWRAVPDSDFLAFQHDSESLVMARMVESRQNGLFAHNALLGWGDADLPNLTEDDYQHQFDAFMSGQPFRSYSLYKSASGGQALLFSALHELSPFPPQVDLRSFQALVALLLAVSISLFIGWLDEEFGLFTALFVTATTLLSQWITLYGRSLFYFIWASFIPLAAMAWYLAAGARKGRISDRGLVTVAFTGILFKCLMNGYDFVIPALSMPFAPLLYYGVRDGWPRGHFLRRSSVVLLAAAAAITVSIAVLAGQLQASEGTFWGGVSSIVGTLGRRTYYADPTVLREYVNAVTSTPLSAVLWTYLTQDAAIARFGLRFLDVIGIFAGVTIAYRILRRLRPDEFPEHRKSRALIAVTWLSLLAPLSWFIVFKGQAVVHTHTNYLAWHMPFTLLGFAMTAWLLGCIGLALLRSAQGSGSTDPST